ncbi:MAG: hypothetical protein JKY70_11445 [Mucilaginibacter sp.]|nr:hypothetical protein [Mucilaginibacter sp.]
MMTISRPLLSFTLSICLIFGVVFKSNSQSTSEIVSELKQLNQALADTPCVPGEGKLINYKAMNVFLSNKVSSYLSDKGDLSLYKNYVNINAAKATIAINHNFHQPVDSEDYVRSFLVVGARASFANTYAARFSNSLPDNQLGFTAQQVWMGKPVTVYDHCGSQKKNMDLERALLIQQLSKEIVEKASAYESALANINPSETPGQDLRETKAALLKKFHAALRLEYLQKFAEAQSELLINTNNYKLVKDHWTILGVYLPVITQTFELTNGVEQSRRHSYPAELFITHTRFWDSPKVGRIFLSASAGCSINNTVQAGQMLKPALDNTYTGNFNKFLTPLVAGKIVYLPSDSHVGISCRLEQNFGSYNALNGILGIPIVLIDEKGVPKVNFECQLIFDNMNRSLITQLPRNRTFVGLTVGIPFSKVVY